MITRLHNSMIRKLMYSFSGLGLIAATSNIAQAAVTCNVNGQIVKCPEWLGPAIPFLFVIWLVVLILIISSYWKIFSKAGKPGWASIVPIYNMVVILEIVKRPIWWIILLFIPFVNIVFILILMNDLSKAFGKGIGFTIGLIFLPLIFFPILAFGKSQYQGTSTMPVTPATTV